MDQSDSKISTDLSRSNRYLSEKLYELIQLYLENKGWYPPHGDLVELIGELEEAGKLPHVSYVEMIASKMSRDSLGRLVLKETGKLIVPSEHFANAVMIKHLSGPARTHLGLDNTVRAVFETYTMGPSQFGMDAKFIVTVVKNCPNPVCQQYIRDLEASCRNVSDIASTYFAPPKPKIWKNWPYSSPPPKGSTPKTLGYYSPNPDIRLIALLLDDENAPCSSQEFDTKHQECKQEPKQEFKKEPEQQIKKEPEEELKQELGQEIKKEPEEEELKQEPEQEIKKEPEEELKQELGQEIKKEPEEEELKQEPEQEIKKEPEEELKQELEQQIKKEPEDEFKRKFKQKFVVPNDTSLSTWADCYLKQNGGDTLIRRQNYFPKRLRD